MSIFRREVLQRMAVPDNLDQLMPLTSSRSWAALIAIAGVLAIGAGWGWIWKTPTKMSAQGVLAPAGGVQSVFAPVRGRLQTISVRPGDIVQPNQPVATVLGADGGAAQNVTAVAPGRAIAVSAGPGDAVDQGTPLVTVTPLDQPLELVMYVPASQATSIRPGLAVRITPAGLSANAFGYLKGTVTSASNFPVTLRQMRETLGTEELARSFGSSGPLVEVHVAPERANTPSGFAWTTGNGPSFPLSGGTLAEATVILRNQRPFKLPF